MKIAVALFAYQRPRYLRRALKTHKKVDGLDYYAFIDHSEMQDYIYGIITETGIYDVIKKRQIHFGLNENIKWGINYLFQTLNYDAVIVLEDDLLIAEDGVEWLMAQLKQYKTYWLSLFAVSLVKGKQNNHQFMCWAWGIWRDRWEAIDWTVKPDKPNRGSWDVIVDAYMKKANLFCFCSDKMRVKHIGTRGVHYNVFATIKEKVMQWLTK